jgi:DNA-directed RNA polymerase specialized sigma24 family protein
MTEGRALEDVLDEALQYNHNLLKHRHKRASLERKEEGARTEDDFKEVLRRWDEVYRMKLRKERKNEVLFSSDMFDWSEFDTEIRMRDEDDVFTWMFCCICQMHELMEDADIYRLLKQATDKQKAVFFPRFIKGCTIQKIAQCHGMTDRNVLKLIDLMLDNIRHGLYEAPTERHKTNPSSATLEEKEFLATYDYKPKEKKPRGRPKKQTPQND